MTDRKKAPRRPTDSLRLSEEDRAALRSRAAAAGMLPSPYAAAVLSRHLNDPAGRFATVGDLAAALAEVTTLILIHIDDGIDDAATREYVRGTLMACLARKGGGQ
jgi:hypothetical protein